jgi:hypothetical protein
MLRLVSSFCCIFFAERSFCLQRTLVNVDTVEIQILSCEKRE